jgi:predicted RNA-binding Zn ribbon-like protein
VDTNLVTAATSERRVSAPGSLVRVQAFVNTLDLETGEELIGSPTELHDWLVSADLLEEETDPPSAEEHARAIRLREALRGLLLAHHADEVLDTADLAVLNQTSAEVGHRVAFDGTSWQLEPAGTGVRAALGSLISIIAAAMTDGTWQRLKVCPADDCRWAFYDTSRNRSGRWCVMAVCGNREKARRYRERRSS